MSENKQKFSTIYSPDLDFTTYCSFKKSYMKEVIRSKSYTVKAIDIAYRVVSHWDDNGLLPRGVKSNGENWRKFSVVERVWIKAVDRLRDFGMPLSKIATACENIMQWNEKEQTYLWFEYCIIRAWFSETDAYIIVLPNGKAHATPIKDNEISKIFSSSKDFIFISLKSILKDIGLLGVPQTKKLFNLTDTETELLSKIRLKEKMELRIRTDGQGSFNEIEESKTIINPAANYLFHKEMENKKVYGQVLTNYEDGIPQSTQIRKRIRFNKKT